MRKIKTYAVSGKALYAMSVECLSALIEECRRIKNRSKRAKEILNLYKKKPELLMTVTTFTVTFTMMHKDLIPTVDVVAEVNEDGEIIKVKPDVQDYLV